MPYETQQYTLDNFRREISGIVEQEAEEGKTADFVGVELRPEEFTGEDMEMWQDFKKNGKDALGHFNEYRESFKDEKSETRRRFLYYVANKLNVLLNGK